MKSKDTIPFFKMNGAGNDFILVDHRHPLFDQQELPDIVRKVCRRKFGVGADGFVLIESSDQADFKWQFFNSDGSVAEMCGNCARCAARFAYIQGIAPSTMHFETLAGIIGARVDGGTEVTITMTPAHSLELSREIVLDDTAITVHSMDTGVPHVVYFVDDIKAVDIDILGPALRYHPVFEPAGTNVNFVSIGQDRIYVRTYERGVEEETYACGTGVVASALVTYFLDKITPPVLVETVGGDTLSVLFNPEQEEFEQHIQLKGPAHIMYRGELSSEVFG